MCPWGRPDCRRRPQRMPWERWICPGMELRQAGGEPDGEGVAQREAARERSIATQTHSVGIGAADLQMTTVTAPDEKIAA